MLKKINSFCRMADFLQYFQPLTPYGRMVKDHLPFYTDSNILNAHFADQERLFKYFKQTSTDILKIEYALKNIPYIEQLTKRQYLTADLFLIKKLLFHFKALSNIMPDNIRETLNIYFQSETLLKLLSLGQAQEQTFYLSEQYSHSLKKVRTELKELQEEIQKVKSDILDKIYQETKLDFRFQDFILIPEIAAVQLDKNLVFMEAYDSQQVIAKPVLSDEYFKLLAKKDNLSTEEKKEERLVIKKLSEEIKKELSLLAQYLEAIEKLDILLAKVRLMDQFNMTKPEIIQHGKPIIIEKGNCIPLSLQCEQRKTSYTPLDGDFPKRINVISGSNMGGKTELLRSLVFFQLLTQTGFYVPAKTWKTPLFDHLFIIGEDTESKIAGLSSFGLEIHNFISAYENHQKRCCFYVDEFARTTNTREATALTQAVLNSFAENSQIYAFFSTHYTDLRPQSELNFYRMKGLDHKRFEQQQKNKTDLPLEERIKNINQFMIYQLVLDNQKHKDYDALTIASNLGLPHDIYQKACQFIGGQNENK
ncbi:MAG: hypothetical protein MJB14_23125 [Spirochaetes bacterium]|nr:hypothetical protein [Spirochaetota bacterium]